MTVGKIEQLTEESFFHVEGRKVLRPESLDELRREIARLRAENKALRERLRLNGVQEP